MKVSKYDYKAGKFNEWNILNDYHCLYILRGDKYFYVGESANVRERMKEHARTKKEDKYNFHTAYIVTDDDSNETVMKLCERLLIMLMRFEKKNVLTNIQKGDKYTFCKNMQEFELKFDKLCFILEKEKIIKAKRFNNVMNIFLLQKNPFRVLNDEQKKTLSSVVRVLESKGTKPADRNYKSRPIFISGGPGTGKTFLAIAFFDYLKKSPFYKDKRIAIVVASPSVRFFIQEIVKAIGYRKKDVIAPVRLTYEKYDIVICDEAQKLRRGVNLNSYAGAFKNGNERLEEIPRFKANVSANYRLTSKLDTTVSYTYMGSKEGQGIMNSSRSLTDVGVRYRVTESLTVKAGINNLFNKEYYESQNNRGLTANPGEERSYYMGFKMTF